MTTPDIAPIHDEHRQRRMRFMEKLGQGTAIVRSASESIMHNDTTYGFRQDSDLFYLTGFDEPEAVAVFAPHMPEEHRFILFVRPKDAELETWSGYRSGVEGAKERYGADEAFPIAEFDAKLPQFIEKAERIYYKPGHDDPFNLSILHHWQKLLKTHHKRGTAPVAIETLGPILHSMRMVKSDYELDQMRKAAAIAAQAHIKAMELAKPGRFEYEIQAEMEYIFRRDGALGPAYPSIVASGSNACVLHYIENKRQLQPGELLLIDAGASVGYYNSDITRTFPIEGRFSDEQRELYSIVLEAQLKAIATVIPGGTFDKMHGTAVRTIVEGLMALGLLVGEIETIIKDELYKPFYMHRTGHWLGLDVHDPGYYRQGETWLPFQPGQVITVEPGIYIGPGITLAEGQPVVPDRYRGIGIRIEDDVLVTAMGNEVLTEAIPKDIATLEYAHSQGPS
jgi:Xaa-Pro aminopeptidase